MSAISPSEKRSYTFVSTSEEDTTFLTRDSSAQVKRAGSLKDIEQVPEGIVVVDACAVSAAEIQELQRSPDTAVIVLADLKNVPVAIEHVRNGADGFLVKGISGPEALESLARYAKAN